MPERPSVWHPEVLPEAWPRAVNDLARRAILEDFYLAGGTGLALQYGHRRSVDLDLFRETAFESRDLGERLRAVRALPGEIRRGCLQPHPLPKALAYFPDAEREPAPDMLVPLDWAAVKEYFLDETPGLARLS